MHPQKDQTTDSYFPVYHKAVKATHIKNLHTGEYHKFPDGQKFIFHYMLDRYKFFTSQGKSYFDNQEEIAIACACVRRSVFSLIRLLEECGYLSVKGKLTFQHRSNSYVFDKELQLAVLEKGKIEEEYSTNMIHSSKLPTKSKTPSKPAYVPKPFYEDEEGLPF